jgi:hypothetical protein
VTSDPAPGSGDSHLPPDTPRHGLPAFGPPSSGPGVPGELVPGQPAYPPPPPGPPGYGPPSYGQVPGYGAPSYGRPGPVPPPYGAPGLMSQYGMLAAAADRERTIDVLKAAYGEGRLTKEEFDLRCGQVISARTYGDLAVLVADLPAGPMGTVAPYQAGYYPPARVPPTNGLAIAALVCGLAEMFTLGLSAIPAVILGHLAHGQIRRTGERGSGLAAAGLIFGYLGIGIWTLVAISLAFHH